MIRTIALAILLLLSPLVSFAVEGTFLIPSWTAPLPSQNYNFTDSVVANGTWQLPPDWAGNIYVYMDAPVDGSGNPIGEGTQMTDLNTGKPYYSVSNAGGTASTSGSFSYNIGPQADGDHNIYIKFIGGSQCAVNKQINAQTGSSYIPTCDITADNLVYIVWAPRDFIVGLPPYPRMVLTPSTTPAHNFANVPYGSSDTRVFTITNTGGQTLTGSISALAAPFVCSPCGYTINPGATVLINVTYTPQTISDSQNQTFNFSCIGSSYGCDGQPYTITYLPRNIIANSVANAIAPILSVSPSSINFGLMNLGSSLYRNITIKNTGGGFLNGTITFNGDPNVYTCVGNPTCSYSLPSGQPTTITIRYFPINAGTHNDIATVNSNVGIASVALNSTVNDLPILSVHPSYTSINFGTNINVGTCRDATTYIRNSGAGLLSGSVTNPPTTVSPPAGTPPGFSCISASCNYSNLSNNGTWTPVTFRFCPTAAGPASDTAIFSNTVNPSAGGSVPLMGNGNSSPIGSFVGAGEFYFGSVLVNATRTASVIIQNTGVGNLSGSVGAMPFPEYVCITNCTYNIAPNTTVTVTIQFTPTAVQSYQGAVLLSGIGTAQTSGSGIRPDFQMSYSGSPLTTCPGTTCVTDLPQTYPRGDYDIGQTTFGGSLSVQNKTFYLYVVNKGSGANVSYSMPSTANFICLSACSGSLGDYTGATVTYEFQPTAATSYTQAIVTTYDNGAGPVTVTLNVTGASVASPYLSVSPNANIPLGNVSVGNTATATFTVTNLGYGFLNGTVSIPTPGAIAPTLGLIRHWTLDDANTNWTTHQTSDLVTGGIGYLPGPISTVGQINEGLNFTGKGGMSVAGISGLAGGNTPHTMSAWIKVNALGPARQWIALLGNESTGSLHWLLNSSGTTGFGPWGRPQVQPILPVGTWVHVATTFDGINLKSYINGVLSQTTPTSFTFPATSPLTVGSQHLNESDFNGSLDDLRLYKRALTATEVGKVYTNTFSPTLDLIGLWSFDDPTVVWSQLKVTDLSPKGNHATLTSVPTAVSGKIGQALGFSGSEREAITVSNSSSLNINTYTVSVWINPAVPVTTWTGIIGKPGRNYNMWLNSSGFIHHRFRSSGGGSNDGAPDAYGIVWNAWNHVVITNNGVTAKTYLNGVEIASGPVSGSVIADNTPLYLGCNLDSCRGNNFKGIIDDVRIYNRSLSGTEVSDLYGAGIAVGLSAFTCVSGCTITNLPSLGAQQVKIEFTPTAAQAYIAYPSFLTNGGNIAYPTAPYPSVTGTGVLDPVIAVSPTNIIFPDTNQGLYSNVTITIQNTGAANLSGSVSPVKTPGLSFYCLSGCNYNIPAGGYATAIIQFAPQSVATLSSVITLNSNAINGTQTINVSGRGVLAPIISLSGADTDFGPVIVSKYKDLNFTIQNAGSSSLGSGYFEVTGPFACVNPINGDGHGHCHYNIGPGDSTTVTIRFSPTVLGPASGAVWLSGVPLARFFVTGRGVSPAVKFIEQ